MRGVLSWQEFYGQTEAVIQQKAKERFGRLSDQRMYHRNFMSLNTSIEEQAVMYTGILITAGSQIAGSTTSPITTWGTKRE